MMRVVSYLGKSEIDGIGCFTAEFISKGDLVWQFDTAIDRELKLDEIKTLPQTTQKFLETYAWLSGNKTILLCADHGGYFNHAENANTYMSENGYRCYAKKDIAADEELTTNYAELPGYAEVASSRLQS